MTARAVRVLYPHSLCTATAPAPARPATPPPDTTPTHYPGWTQFDHAAPQRPNASPPTSTCPHLPVPMPNTLRQSRRTHTSQVGLSDATSVRTPCSYSRPHRAHLPPNIIPSYILTDTCSHALASGPAKTDNSAYRGGVAVLSLSHDYYVSKTPLPPDIPLPADFEHQVLPCILKHIPTSTV